MRRTNRSAVRLFDEVQLRINFPAKPSDLSFFAAYARETVPQTRICPIIKAQSEFAPVYLFDNLARWGNQCVPQSGSEEWQCIGRNCSRIRR